ncbi:MAG: AMP-binding protein [Candidatus Manganitrophus sp.]|nr:AMP-binding protein [Candidatus Manganitrophus sp.]
MILTHRNYLFDVAQFVQPAQITEQDRLLCILPLFHVNGQVVTTLGPLFVGGSMVLMEKFSPKEFFNTLERFRATAFSGVPTIYADSPPRRAKRMNMISRRFVSVFAGRPRCRWSSLRNSRRTVPRLYS